MKDNAQDKGTLAITYAFETRGMLLCDSKTLLRLPSSAMDAHRFKVRTRPKFRGRYHIGISVNSLAAQASQLDYKEDTLTATAVNGHPVSSYLLRGKR